MDSYMLRRYMSCVQKNTYSSHIYILTHILYIYTVLYIYLISYPHSIQDTVDSATHDLCSLPGLPAITCHDPQLRQYHRAEPSQHHLYLGQHCRTNTCGAQRFPGFEKSPWFRWVFGKFSADVWLYLVSPASSTKQLFGVGHPCGSWIFSDLWDEGSIRYIIMTWCRDSTFKQQFMDAESLQNLPSWDISKKT